MNEPYENTIHVPNVQCMFTLLCIVLTCLVRMDHIRILFVWVEYSLFWYILYSLLMNDYALNTVYI